MTATVRQQVDLLNLVERYCVSIDATPAQAGVLTDLASDGSPFVLRLALGRKLTLDEIRAAPELNDEQRYALAFGAAAPIDSFAVSPVKRGPPIRDALARGTPLTAAEEEEIHREAYRDVPNVAY